MSTAVSAAASAVTSTSVWAGPLRWAVIQAPATARQARGYTHSDGRARWFRRARQPSPRIDSATWAPPATTTLRRARRSHPRRCPGSEYPGEPVLRLTDDVEQVLVRCGQPAAGKPAHELLRDEVPMRARQPSGQPAQCPALRDHEAVQHHIGLDARSCGQPFVHRKMRARLTGLSLVPD